MFKKSSERKKRKKHLIFCTPNGWLQHCLLWTFTSFLFLGLKPNKHNMPTETKTKRALVTVAAQLRGHASFLWLCLCISDIHRSHRWCFLPPFKAEALARPKAQRTETHWSQLIGILPMHFRWEATHFLPLSHSHLIQQIREKALIFVG